MSREMEGKAVLVTGASSGIGRATALRFAAEGAQVGLVARSAPQLAEVDAEIAAAGGSALAIPADVSREADIQRAVSATVEAFGGIDVLVNAAGIIATGTVKETTLESWDYMMNVNVRAPFYLIQQALPYLEERQGNVVNVSSVTGLRSFPGILSYCTSKAAVDQLTRCVALETASMGVRVNAINPGARMKLLKQLNTVSVGRLGRVMG